MDKIIIVGMGAAGMMAACLAAENGNEVIIFDKNEKAGKKLYITGKGRCNITNACDIEELFNSIVSNPKFMNSSIRRFNNFDTVDFFERIHLKTKIERGNRVFPVSDHSSDVIKALRNRMEELGVKLIFNTRITDIITKVTDGEQGFKAVRTDKGDIIEGNRCFVATGGLSYPTTGSTGDGYRFAMKLGHNIIDTSPSLVPIYIKEKYVHELQGLSLKNITLSIFADEKKVYSDFGEMLFTHFGISGPVVISASAYITKYIENKIPLKAVIDLKPALSEEQLDARLMRDFEAVPNKQFKNALDKLLPQRLIDVIIGLSGISPEKKINSITKEERLKLARLLKNFTMSPYKLGEYNEAVITKGGIDVKEINPKTMESKKVKGIHFIGEILDVDALTGGFNLQIAWSTAAAAAGACGKQEEI